MILAWLSYLTVLESHYTNYTTDHTIAVNTNTGINSVNRGMRYINNYPLTHVSSNVASTIKTAYKSLYDIDHANHSYITSKTEIFIILVVYMHINIFFDNRRNRILV